MKWRAASGVSYPRRVRIAAVAGETLSARESSSAAATE
jgi:hypothetical protein